MDRMTQHHPTTPTDTPAPAAGDDDRLNVDIAMAVGWKTIPRGNGFLLIEPSGKERWDGASHIEAECWRVVPEYDRDPAAALGLLAHVLSLRTDFAPFVLHRMQKSEQGKWLVLIGVEGSGESIGVADTLERAIAKACRDALAAIAREARESE